ncbi:glycosyltransferase [Desulfolutivibrio sulfoxidireducens]|uniref:glycosyltransferase n=1 Tax=Desulfolutivibrio sulfoxidireducens TaxID=2773299 RepID=UPI00159E27CB|nr:glycosyltransferase [Desulfolutivibrio sulfoxidireducens]QLA18725.1 glycosyltransferase [Desulfolutivibrio sulfoxidireducens]
MPHPFFIYTETVRAFALGPNSRAGGPDAPPVFPARNAERFRDRVLRALASGAARHVVLFGLGSGRAAWELSRALPPEASLTVVCLDPALARGAARTRGLSWIEPDGRAQLLCDASPWAVWLLARQAGIKPGNSMAVFSPEPLDPREKTRLVALKRLFAGATEVRLPPAGPESGPGGPRISFAAVLSPEEPDLEGFFAAVPPGMSEAVAVWDATDVPHAARAGAASPVPVRHLARPLGRDFAAQRNAMLGACGGDWVFFLDADERPEPGLTAMLSGLAAMPGIGAFAFPRLTLYPDEGHAKVGYGLWPDLQTRLFRRRNPDGTGPRFERPVHERLAGLAGKLAVVPSAPILHVSRLLKDRETLAAKLRGFDAAAAGGVSHRVNREYPFLPRAFFSGLSVREPSSVLVFPGGGANPAAPVDLREGTG